MDFLTRNDKRTIVKGGLLFGVLALSWPAISAALIVLAFGALLVVIGIAAAIEWFMRYGLIALGIWVIAVLTLRWLHGGGKRSTSGAAFIEELASRSEAEPALPAVDPAKALEQFKLEQELELAAAKAREEGRKVDAP